MHALEAKTCENRRFWGRFQKNLVVWKEPSVFVVHGSETYVSEELSSVESLFWLVLAYRTQKSFRRT